eukprot:CAMPEP_0116138860 /NCGR_PEP_ID=MMETSP0329-20121206/13000_1 /TAXON_ID=697910 /ORGANISM="Pseudo-nitzschia arenysensis, Strain B593" /LENGTH=595 /DNA_ID=CAMNT_0003633857 /DNA_START=69 /DNA_END=1856 /DNA_ORIENTATION=+
MTAIQLDYRFEADYFRTEWWPLAELLGFTRVDYYHFRLPSSFDVDFDPSMAGIKAEDQMVHKASTLCMKLNALSIPQGRSVYDRIGDGYVNTSIGVLERSISNNRFLNLAWKRNDVIDRWTAVREQLIFRKFHSMVTKECRCRDDDKKMGDKGTGKTKRTQRRKRDQSSISKGGTDAATVAPKRKLWSSADAGAELLFHKGKRGKGKLPGKDPTRGNRTDNTHLSEKTSINYAETMKTYKDFARNHQLAEKACEREKNIVESSSLLFYGVGSKKNLMQSFSNQDMDGDVIEINGFDNSLTVDGILQLLVDQWLEGREPTIRKMNLFHNHFEKNDRINRSNTAERITPFFPRHGDFHLVQKAVAIAKRIARQVMKTSRPITLVIHNIDGVGLSNGIAQEVLAVLVSQSRTDCGLNAIRLVASVDNVHGQLYTESHSRHLFQWLRQEVHTHRPYVEEVVQEQATEEKRGAMKSKKSSEEKDPFGNNFDEEEYLTMEHESIFSVLKSLASTHAESLRQLARLQLDSDHDWVNYIDLLKQCRASRIVQADQQLRLYMGELMDHNILERDKSKGSSSMALYRIPYSDEILNLIWNFKTDR